MGPQRAQTDRLARTLTAKPPSPDAPPIDPVQYAHGPPSQAGLMRRQDELKAAGQGMLKQVEDLVRTQRDLGSHLKEDLATLHRTGGQLDRIERASQAGGLASLVRFFNRRRTILERQSVSEELLGHYEAVTVQLRHATAFTDELRLCALELQAQVDGLHGELAAITQDGKAAAAYILDLERALDALERNQEDDRRDSDDPVQLQRDRARDRLEFDERTATIDLQLLRARAELLHQHMDPTRELRDTVMHLHQEMATFVLNATEATNAAGRRIQALGMAADAPTVIGELGESLAKLDEAMTVTEDYVRQTQDLITRVLPDLNARLEAQGELDEVTVNQDLQALGRARARAMAEKELKDAARREVDALQRTL